MGGGGCFKLKPPSRLRLDRNRRDSQRYRPSPTRARRLLLAAALSHCAVAGLLKLARDHSFRWAADESAELPHAAAALGQQPRSVSRAATDETQLKSCFGGARPRAPARGGRRPAPKRPRGAG